MITYRLRLVCAWSALSMRKDRIGDDVVAMMQCLYTICRRVTLAGAGHCRLLQIMLQRTESRMMVVEAFAELLGIDAKRERKTRFMRRRFQDAPSDLSMHHKADRDSIEPRKKSRAAGRARVKEPLPLIMRVALPPSW